MLQTQYAYPAFEYHPTPHAGRQPLRTLPDGAADRVHDMDIGAVVEMLNERLSVHTHAVDDDPVHHIDVVGVGIVGSFITPEFVPRKSDLDIVPILSEPYDGFESYARSVRYGEKRWNGLVVPKMDTDAVRMIDPLDFATPDTVGEVLSPPYIVFQ